MLQFQVQIIGKDRQLLHSLPCQVKDKADLWEHLAEIAAGIDVPGSRLHVIDANGEIIIRVGIVSARQTQRRRPIAA
ncbi:MAG: hypothetical protein EBY21_03370 [Alphaproteobacteria bacterium]|nr:hypothetical protein [Alphaproteobacteria bacterium]